LEKNAKDQLEGQSNKYISYKNLKKERNVLITIWQQKTQMVEACG